MPLFNTLFPEFFSLNSANQYLPFNVVKNSNDSLTLEIALAGISEDDVDVEVSGDMLIVSNKNKQDTRNYVYKGISTRSFNQKFKLREDVMVKSGNLKDGMLSINLEVKIPEDKKTRKLKLKN
jgi:molecular chaperone IbpA